MAEPTKAAKALMRADSVAADRFGVGGVTPTHLLALLDEHGWTLVEKDEIDRTVGDLEDQLREERAVLADLRQQMAARDERVLDLEAEIRHLRKLLHGFIDLYRDENGDVIVTDGASPADDLLVNAMSKLEGGGEHDA